MLTRFTLVFLLLSAFACQRQPIEADLGELYNRSAQASGVHRNPVIVIPGILGSRLVDRETGQVIWGVVGDDFIDPDDPVEARKLALPLAGTEAQLKARFATIEPDGVLDTLQFELAGFVIELGAYVDILKALGVRSQSDDRDVEPGDLQYGDHVVCYQFDYDWRRDIVKSAQALDAFIEAKRVEVRKLYREEYGVDKPIKFDIVAHSMGGLVARYYLRYGATDLDALGENPTPTWAGAANVEKVILVGTPNAGSVKSMKYLIEGRNLGPLLPKYPSSLLGTYPSMYQMLPRPRHGAMLDEQRGEKVDFLNPELWQTMGWGLADTEQRPMIEMLAPGDLPWSEVRRLAIEHQAQTLQRSKQFFRAMDVPAKPPATLSTVLVVGDGEATPAVMTLNRRDGKVSITKEAPGDGMVLRSSVLMDERLGGEWEPRLVSPIRFRSVLLLNASHLGMTKDRTFTDNLLFYLLEAPDYY